MGDIIFFLELLLNLSHSKCGKAIRMKLAFIVVVVQVVLVQALPKESDSTGEQAAPAEQAADPDAANEIDVKKAILRNKRADDGSAKPASASSTASSGVPVSAGQTTHGPKKTPENSSSGLFTSILTNTISLIYAIFMI